MVVLAKKSKTQSRKKGRIKLNHHTSSYSESRLIHDVNQITSPEKIIAGSRYYQVNLRPSGERAYHEIKITSVDLETGKYRAKHYCKFDGLEIGELEHSLADLGILPYNSPDSFYHRKWNARNWLVLKEE